MLGFGPLRSAFNARELDGFIDIMAERGIRMRTGVEEGTNCGYENEHDSEEGSEDEIEHEARERRQLMPY